jgi:hypothetical protein
MVKTIQPRKVRIITRLVFVGSALLGIISLIIGGLTDFVSITWAIPLRFWSLFLYLPLGTILLITVISIVKWLFFSQGKKDFIVINSFVFICSIALLFITLNFLQWIDDRAYSAQRNIVQKVCREGFNDPSTLEQYRAGKVAIGYWDSPLVWEDETHNAIWFDSCGSLSSCGTICIREGMELKDAINDYEYHKFKHIRDNLYGWD